MPRAKVELGIFFLSSVIFAQPGTAHRSEK